MYIRRIVVFLFVLAPAVAAAHSGGLDGRGGHHCWTDCEAHGLRTAQYHFHPEKMDEDQRKQYEAFKGRLCERVVRHFSADEKMWSRVNERVENRFGFACMTGEDSDTALHEASADEPSARHQPEAVQVMRVIDGDTIEVRLANGEFVTVRFIGIDTPETVHPSQPVECYGAEASQKLKRTLSRQPVTLESKPDEDEDVYGRKLRYVHHDGQDIGAMMIGEGYAFSYVKYPHPRLDDYNALEREAREAGRGLWGAMCEY